LAPIDSQSASLRASQLHSRFVETTIEPDPPGAPTAAGSAVAETLQRAPLGPVIDLDDSVPHAPVRNASATIVKTLRLQLPICAAR
jgi:hypothetical protein